MKQIELKEIILDIDKVYLNESYIETGMYLVNNNEIMWFNTSMKIAMFVCFYHEISSSVTEKEEEVKELEVKEVANYLVSENLLLKTIALAMNKEKYKDVE